MLELHDYQVDVNSHLAPLPVSPTATSSGIGATSMLDAVEPTDLRCAIQRWRSDADCIARGDEYAILMLRCWAAAGLSDKQIVERTLGQLATMAIVDTQHVRYDAAAIMVARHCASVDMTLANVIAVLAHLVAEIPCWPSADEIAAIAQAAVAEFA
jgi:hypothetical protein